MTHSHHRTQITVGVLATLLLTGLSVLVLTTTGDRYSGFPSSASCPAPTLPGTVVNLTLTNMGGPMMGQHPIRQNNTPMGGAMRLTADRATIPAGTVSFLATNDGTLTHEAVILPLPDAQIVGTRPVGGDAKIDEEGSLAESSTTCGAGPGQGIVPGASGWVTTTLTPGRYELLCDLPGHYTAGMYTQLTVV